MRKFFPFTRRKGSADTRIKGAGGGGDDGGGSRSGRHDVNRHSIGSYSSVSNRSMVIQLIRGAYNIDLAKVDQSFTKLHKSCFLNQDLNKIRKYLKQGANPNQLDNVSRSSPLHLATVNGNLNIIRLLIENGGNIDLTDGDGKTLAIKAVECFHKDCLQFLILQGANLNLSDNLTGNTVLHWSIVNNFTDGLRLCLAYAGRVDVNRKNKSGESALHLLVKYPDLHEYIGDLLDKGAEIDLRNNLQQTPLMMTCEYGYLEAARMLINRGSYIYHQDESGFTALGIAKRNGHLALSKYLTDLGGVDQLTRPESEVTPNETKTTAIDSWPSTEEEDEDEIVSKTRKFDPIIQQLKSLQGGGGGLIVTSGNKKSDKVLQSSESNQQQRENNQQSTDQLKAPLDQQSNYEMNNRKGQSPGSTTNSTVNPTVKPATSIESNGQEILGTFFLNNISDDDDESDDDDGKSIDEIERDVKKMKDKESRGGKMDDGDEDNDRNSEYKRKEREVKKDLKSSEVEKKKNPLVKEEKTFSSSSSTHQPEHGTFSFSLTPIREEAISSSTSSSLSPSMDKKSNVPTNLMTSQSSSPPLPPPPPVNFSPPSSSPPLLPPPPPPPPPPSISFTSSSLSSLSSFPPPALPPRPSTSKLTIDTLRGKDKSIELQRSSIEVQTELDELSPRFTELEHLRIESEKRVKSLEIELSKQSREADERRNQLIEEINCMERERKLLESRLEEMKESREKLIVEKKVLILNEAKLQKQLESHEECKCPQLKEELKQVKESVKSHRNHCNDEFIRKLHDLNDECNDLRRELSAEQTALKDEISQLEKDKELFKLENQWLKDKLDEMRIEMRKHFLLSSDDNKEPTDQHDHSQHHHHLQPGSKESRIISKRKKRKQGKEETDYNDDGKEEEDDDDDGDDDDLGDNDTIENETLESMRKTMVTVESLLRKLDDKISTLNLEDQKKLMEKIIVEIAKTQINLQVESMFKGIRSLLEDLHRQLISFQSTIDQQQSNNQVKQQTNDEDEMMKMKSSDDDKLSELDLDHDENHEHGGGGGKENKEKQLKDDSSNCSPTTKKIIANGFSVFESRISQLTSSIEKLEDNIERQELNMLIQARGSIWSTLTDPTGMVMDTGHYRRDVNNNSILINYVNRNEVNQLAQRKPQSIFVQSLMRLQSSKPIDGKSNYLKLINGNTNNYEPSFDFNYTKNNLSKQIDSLKSELGLSR